VPQDKRTVLLNLLGVLVMLSWWKKPHWWNAKKDG